MTPKIIVRYSIRRQGIPELYDVYDEEAGQYYSEPMPYDEAIAEKQRAQGVIKFAEALSNVWGWAAQAP